MSNSSQVLDLIDLSSFGQHYRIVSTNNKKLSRCLENRASAACILFYHNATVHLRICTFLFVFYTLRLDCQKIGLAIAIPFDTDEHTDLLLAYSSAVV